MALRMWKPQQRQKCGKLTNAQALPACFRIGKIYAGLDSGFKVDFHIGFRIGSALSGHSIKKMLFPSTHRGIRLPPIHPHRKTVQVKVTQV